MLSGCPSIWRTKTITVREPVFPPLEHLEYCKGEYGQGSLQDINDGLVELVLCERADKDAIKAWADSYNVDSNS